MAESSRESPTAGNGVAQACAAWDEPGAVFARCGLASLDDLETREWRALLSRLERAQEEFRRRLPAFRSPAYRWPSDPLHRATRVWEYPYVLGNLLAWQSAHSGPHPLTVVDLGSGVTFLPFALAAEGFRVIAVDRDAVCAVEFERAIPLFPTAAGRLSFELADACALPFEEGTVDAVVCVSVLEHVQDLAGALREVCRVLSPTGVFLLTVDLDLTGTGRLGPHEYAVLQEALSRLFSPLWPETVTHPSRLLTSDTSPWGYRGMATTRRALIAARDALCRCLPPLWGKREKVSVATYGACFQPRRVLDEC